MRNDTTTRPTSRKATMLLAVPVVSVSLAVAGCGGSSKTPTAADTVPAGATVNTAVAAGDPASQCPAQSTQKFAKTRFVTNLALSSGAFYQWLYKPYQAGKFTKGAKGRTTALVKASLAGAFAAKQLNDATKNVKADPTLCKAFITPLTSLSKTLDSVKDKVKGGDVSALAGAGTAMDELLNTAKKQGMNITPKTDVSF